MRSARKLVDEPGGPVSETELQQDMQRFVGAFSDRMTQAAEASASGQYEQREAVMRRLVLYASSALDIATGPLPEVNLLDMIVFVRLSRETLEQHWMPNVLGEQARPMLLAFVQSERDLWQLAGKVITPAQGQQLRDLIVAWRKEHPDQVRVESIRFGDFAVQAGKVEDKRARAASGLLGSVRLASATADRAVMLGERAIFLAHRAPFLLRLQARLGAQELIDDTLRRFDAGDVDAMVARSERLQPVLRDVADLLDRSRAAAHETRLLLDSLAPLLAQVDETGATAGREGEKRKTQSLPQVLRTSHRLLDKVTMLLDRTEKLTASSADAVALAGKRVDHLVRVWIFYLVLLGASWSLFYWTGHYLANRRAAPPAAQSQTAAPRASAPPASHPRSVGYRVRSRGAGSRFHARSRAHSDGPRARSGRASRA